MAQLAPGPAATGATQSFAKPAVVRHIVVVLLPQIPAELLIFLHTAFNDLLFFVIAFHYLAAVAFTINNNFTAALLGKFDDIGRVHRNDLLAIYRAGRDECLQP